MKKQIATLQLCVMAIAIVGTSVAQERDMSPPKVLVITREFVKPGKAGPSHEKTESAFVAAEAAAKWPVHYLAMDSMTGPPRSLFMTGYDSFEAWEKDTLATIKNKTLSAALSKASVVDGELLSSIETSTFVYRDDLSLNANNLDVAKMRYFDISQFKVRSGHGKDWENLAKQYKEQFSKAVPDAHYAVFEEIYGHDGGGLFIIVNPMKSLSEVDKGFGDSKKFAEAAGDETLKKMDEQFATSTDYIGANLFAFNPAESYSSPDWIKSDPDFWKPKAAAPAKKLAQ
jgi:hypothetical protein